MSKKVLIVESSLAVRGIAESLLRQNGYEVVAAETAAAAREILHGSKVDLLLIASDVLDDNGQHYYEALGTDSSTAMLPLLVLHDSSAGEEIAYPPEAIINKPFTPRDFLEAVSVFGGKQAAPEASPLSGADLEDAIIDSALGLDKIEVDDTEVLEADSSVYRKQNRKDEVESMIGYEFEVKADESSKIQPKDIDAINVPPDTPKPKPPSDPRKPAKEEQEFLGKHEDRPAKKPDALSESSKIEIVTDQFGISLPEETFEFHDQSDSGGSHDYDWFLKELRKESEEEAAGSDKIVKPEASAQKPPSPAAAPPKPEPTSTHTEAVDKFISEFRKEMEKITGDASSNIEVTNIAPQKTEAVSSKSAAPAESDDGLSWEEGLERIAPADIRVISKQLIEIMAGEIAAKIVARLDEDIIYHLIKESIDNLVQRHASEKSRKR